jgi:hypothetical protein
MSDHDKTPPKAYKNLAFLNSSQARTLRILAEYLEPIGQREAQVNQTQSGI